MKLVNALFVFPNSNEQKKKVAVAEALSNLVVYTGSVKFISFTYSKDNQSDYENTSMAEKKARKLAKTSGKVLFMSVETNYYLLSEPSSCLTAYLGRTKWFKPCLYLDNSEWGK